MQKKGIGQVILWVLLIGLAVSSAVIYFNWMQKTTETLSESTIEYVEGGMGCAETYAKVSGIRGCSHIKVTNNGAYTLQKIALRIINNLGINSMVREGPIAPQESKEYILNVIDTKEMEILPIIKPADKLIGCEDKKFRVMCGGLTEIQKFTCKKVHYEDKCPLLENINIVTAGECCENLKMCCELAGI